MIITHHYYLLYFAAYKLGIPSYKALQADLLYRRPNKDFPPPFSVHIVCEHPLSYYILNSKKKE